jgi:hypothetical protein
MFLLFMIRVIIQMPSQIIMIFIDNLHINSSQMQDAPKKYYD